MPNLLCPKCGGEWYKCVCFSYEKSGYQNINYPIALAWQEKAESLAKENEEFKKNEQYYETVAFRNGKNDERIAELEKQLDEALGQCRICVEKNRIEKLEAQLASLQARVDKAKKMSNEALDNIYNEIFIVRDTDGLRDFRIAYRRIILFALTEEGKK